MNTIETIAQKINAFATPFLITEEAVTVTSYRQTGDLVRVFFNLDRTVGKTPEQIAKMRQKRRSLNELIPDPFKDGTGPTPEPEIKPVTGFAVNVPATVELLTTVTATVNITPSNATDKTYTVTANPAGIVEILNGGAMIKGLVTGSTTLTYHANGGSVPDVVKTIEVTAKSEVKPTSVAITPSTVGPKIDETVTFAPLVLPVGAANKTLTYVSSNPAVLQIVNAETGEAKAISAGTATVVATSVADTSVKSAAVSITVLKHDATDLTYITDPDVTANGNKMTVGQSFTVETEVVPSTADQEVVISINNASLTLNASTKTLTAAALGTTRVTLKTKDNKVTKFFDIEVVETIDTP